MRRHRLLFILFCFTLVASACPKDEGGGGGSGVGGATDGSSPGTGESAGVPTGDGCGTNCVPWDLFLATNSNERAATLDNLRAGAFAQEVIDAYELSMPCCGVIQTEPDARAPALESLSNPEDAVEGRMLVEMSAIDLLAAIKMGDALRAAETLERAVQTAVTVHGEFLASDVAGLYLRLGQILSTEPAEDQLDAVRELDSTDVIANAIVSSIVESLDG